MTFDNFELSYCTSLISWGNIYWPHLSNIQRQTLCLETDLDLDQLIPLINVCSPPFILYWCLGVGSDVTQSAVQFIQCPHLSCKLDNGYVKILPPMKVGIVAGKSMDV
jgi:hypothetical protein